MNNPLLYSPPREEKERRVGCVTGRSDYNPQAPNGEAVCDAMAPEIRKALERKAQSKVPVLREENLGSVPSWRPNQHCSTLQAQSPRLSISLEIWDDERKQALSKAPSVW